MAELRVPELSSETLSATCVAVDDAAVLIEGRTIEQRTDLALCLLDRGGALVAAQSTVCHRQGSALLASPVAGQRGSMDIRGLGSVAMPHVERVPVALSVALLDPEPRFAEALRTRRIAGVDVPVLPITPGDPAAPMKIRLALQKLRR